MSSPNTQRLVRYLAGVAVALGLLAAFVGSPRKQANARLDLDQIARTVESDDDNVTAVELGDWIRNQRSNIRIVDVRDSAEFEDYHIPRAERIALGELTSTPFRNDETVVLYSGADGRAAQGWVFLRAMGFTRVYFLKGGLYEWIDEVMNPAISPSASENERAEFEKVSAISRYFGGAPVVGERKSSRPSIEVKSKGSVREAVSRIRGRGC
ncbi:MAG: rhodanese-like domain-containing protein [Gemmatimonadales bacterium]